MRNAILALLSALMLFGQSAYAAAEKRVALVLGLSTYQEVPALSNPRNDAADVAEKLRKLGFEVVEGHDLDHSGLMGKIREFSKAMTGADAALFYYSGHGIQVDGSNYLVPVDTKLSDASSIDFELVKLDLITDQMQNAQAEKTLKVGLVFLDACRNNPLTRNLKSASRAIGSGLAKVQDAPHGMLIAFSTQPGNVALDGIGRNSPFTKAVLNNIDKPGLSVGDMLINVRTEVMGETADKQVPWENSSLTGQFYFNPAEEVGTSEPARPAEEPRDTKQVLTVDNSALDMKFWESIASSSNPAMFAAYLKKFPDGNFADLAHAKIEELSQKRAIAVEEATSAPRQQIAQNPNQDLQQAQHGPAMPQQNAQVASLGEQPTANLPAAGSFEAAVMLQRELQRVGCYSGALDGEWGRGSRRALQRFNGYTNSAYSLDTPSPEAITAVTRATTQVCIETVTTEPSRPTIRCARGQVVRGGTCVWVQKRTTVRRAPSVVFSPGGVRIPFSIGIGF